MKTKWIFIIIIIFITGLLTGLAFLLYREEPVPFWVMQCMALASVVFSVFLYKTLIKPYQLIVNGIQLLKEQDFSTHLHPVHNKDANQLIELFNKMISHLRSERLAVREKNHFLDLLIHASPQGIIILDFDKKISDINPAGLKLLDISNLSDVKGKRLEDTNSELAISMASLKTGEEKMIRKGGISVYRCIRSSFVDQGFDHPFILIQEVTQEWLKVEKKSYEGIIRMMSHEVNNSVGAISSTLNVVSEIFKQESREEWNDVLPAVDATFDRCGHLADFIQKLAHVVKIPEPSFSPVYLNEQAKAVEALTRMECYKRNIRLNLILSPEETLVYIDGIQFEQVLVNIIKNAYESIRADGEIRIITQSQPVSIIIEDNGAGIQEEDQTKIFTPFFTTKSSGQGIGLMFVREVLVNHHCKFSLTTENGWTRFVILFP